MHKASFIALAISVMMTPPAYSASSLDEEIAAERSKGDEAMLNHDYERAQMHFKKERDLARGRGKDSMPFFIAECDLASSYAQARNYEQALPMTEKLLAIAVAKKKAGALDDTMKTTLNSLAESYKESCKKGSKSLCYRQALSIREVILEPNHFQIEATISSLGRSLVDEKHYREGIVVLKRGLALHEKRSGKGTPESIKYLTRLGIACDRSGQTAEAERYYRQAMVISDRTGSPYYRDDLHRFLGKLLMRTGREAEARVVLEKGKSLTKEQR